MQKGAKDLMQKQLLLSAISFLLMTCSPPKEPPTVMVVFGVSGDLATHKVLPAINQLSQNRSLPEEFALVGIARKAETVFRKQINNKIHYIQADLKEDSAYEELAKALKKIDHNFGAKSNRIYFLATQPSAFAIIVEKLHTHGLIEPPHGKNWSRVLIEKPFGHDLSSAVALQKNLSQYLDETQIYRVDHYLTKAGVQNLLKFRQKKDLEPFWNNQYIDSVEITLSESAGIGSRGKFWEETGLLRDVVQNHMMQLVSLTAMDLPSTQTSLSEKKMNVLKAIRPLDLESTLRGQYGPGEIQGTSVIGYKEEEDVPPSSTVETFVATTLFIDNDRWEGVPFFIRSGKRLHEQKGEILLRFKSGEILHVRIQPNPAIFFESKCPSENNSASYPTEGYEKLIVDSIAGNQNSFAQKEEQLAAWQLLTPLLDHWKSQEEIPIYPAGSRNPLESLK